MARAAKIFKRILLVTYFVILHVIAAFYLYQAILPNGLESLRTTSSPINDPVPRTDVPTPLPVPSELADPYVVQQPADGGATAPVVYESPSGLLIPVAGVRPEQLTDTFASSRSSGRGHDAIDIMAPAGTPVVAVADGTILKFFDSESGGITIYQLSDDKKFIYYYAHLQMRSDGLREGDPVKKGATIGFVGDTGNSGAGNYHLHFAISETRDPKRFWDGTPINPYPLLVGSSHK